MRRSTICVGLAMALLLGVVASAAAAHKQPTGDRISLTGAAVLTYPAGDAFYIRHGHSTSSLSNEVPGLGKYGFTLEVDGGLRVADFKETTNTGHGYGDVLWTFNFPEGMSGIHTFTGHWYAPCDDLNVSCGGLPRNTIVESFQLTVVVTYE